MKHQLTKKDLVSRISKATGITPEKSKTAVETVLSSIRLALANGKHIELRGFGSFEIQVHKSRIGRNPQVPEKAIIIPNRAVVKFKPGQELKKQLKSLDVNDLQKLL